MFSRKQTQEILYHQFCCRKQVLCNRIDKAHSDEGEEAVVFIGNTFDMAPGHQKHKTLREKWKQGYVTIITAHVKTFQEAYSLQYFSLRSRHLDFPSHVMDFS